MRGARQFAVEFAGRHPLLLFRTMITDALRRPAALAAVGATLASLSMAAQPAKAAAVGLSGPFSPSKWSLQRSINGTVVDVLGFDKYQCSSISDLSCVSITSTGVPSSFEVVGSDAGDIGQSAQQVDIAWILNFTQSTPYTIKFTFDFDTVDGTEQDEGQFFINDTKLVFDSTGGVPIHNNLFTVKKGDSLSFRVFSANNQGGPGVLNITDFRATPVPGPLPILGVAGAWKWSRRLRSSLRRSRS